MYCLPHAGKVSLRCPRDKSREQRHNRRTRKAFTGSSQRSPSRCTHKHPLRTTTSRAKESEGHCPWSRKSSLPSSTTAGTPVPSPAPRRADDDVTACALFGVALSKCERCAIKNYQGMSTSPHRRSHWSSRVCYRVL